MYCVTSLGEDSYKLAAATAAKSLQSCPTLCDPIDGSPSGSTIPGILQARILEWVAISFSNAWKWKVKVKSLSGVQPPATPWTAAYQAPPSMGFSRQEYCCSWFTLNFASCAFSLLLLYVFFFSVINYRHESNFMLSPPGAESGLVPWLTYVYTCVTISQIKM